MPRSNAPPSSQQMEQMFRDLGMIPKDIYSEVFSKKSNCPRVIRNKINCNPSNDERMRQIMCLPTGELVMTEEGLKPIETIQVGTKVLTHNGRFRKVTQTFKREYNGDIIEIKTNGSPIPLRVTPEHPALGVKILRPLIHRNTNEMLILQSQWFEAKTLTKEMMLQYPILTEQEDIPHINWRAVPKRNGSTLKSLNVDVEEDFLTLCGYYVAEGAVLKWKGQTHGIKLTFGKNLKEFFLAIDAVARSVKMGLGAWVAPHVTGYTVYVTSRSLGEYIRQNFGTGSANKQIPVWLLKLPSNKIKWFFDAYIEGDGYRHKGDPEIKLHSHIKASTVSPQLAVGLKNIGIKLNYRTGVRMGGTGKSTGIILGRTVNLQPLYIIQFNEHGRRKDSRIYLDEKYIYLKIKEIKTTHYTGSVWNLEIEEDQSYCTAYHTVHNCRSWYKVTTKCGEDTLLVEQFRDNLHKVWKEYNIACNRTPKTKSKSKSKMIEKPAGGWF